jgi:hypothetical protein
MSYRGSNPRRSDRLSGRSYLVGEYFSFMLFRYHSIFSTSFLFIGVSFFTATCTVCDSSANTLKKNGPPNFQRWAKGQGRFESEVEGASSSTQGKKRSARFQDWGQVDYRNGMRESLFSIHVVKELTRLILRIVKERFCPDEGISDMAIQILSNYLNQLSQWSVNLSIYTRVSARSWSKLMNLLIRRVSPEYTIKGEERYNKREMVYSIMRHCGRKDSTSHWRSSYAHYLATK